MDPTELKRLKEEFVSNLEGTTMLEISCVLGLTPVAIFFRLVLAAFLDQSQRTHRSHPDVQHDRLKAAASSSLSALLDFLVIVMPSLYCMTYPEAVWPFALFFSTASALLVLVAKKQRGVNILCFPCPSKCVQAGITSPRKPFLSKYRATMMLQTVIAILAVDFLIFPRRFGKAETYGTGLMDVGVGSFVVANGVVSREARGVYTPPRSGLHRTSPLLLGFARLAATKAAGYQEHVGEYGTHWNFFFTLAAVELLTSAARMSSNRAGLAGALVLAGYQAALSKGGLSQEVMSNQRGKSLLSQNKEGVASACGYWALYLLSVQLGRFFATSAAPLTGDSPQGEPKAAPEGDLNAGRHWWRFAGKVWGLQIVLWACAILADGQIERVSRRSCNLAYVLWMLAFNLQAISMFVTIDLLLPPRACPLLEAIDFNLLPVFLLGNLLTGMVNMSVDTLHTPPAQAFLILTLYVGVVCCTAWVLHQTRVRLAFW